MHDFARIGWIAGILRQTRSVSQYYGCWCWLLYWPCEREVGPGLHCGKKLQLPTPFSVWTNCINTNRWLSARLWYFQCVSFGDTALNHWNTHSFTINLNSHPMKMNHWGWMLNHRMKSRQILRICSFITSGPLILQLSCYFCTKKIEFHITVSVSPSTEAPFTDMDYL